MSCSSPGVIETQLHSEGTSAQISLTPKTPALINRLGRILIGLMCALIGPNTTCFLQATDISGDTNAFSLVSWGLCMQHVWPHNVAMVTSPLIEQLQAIS